MRILYVAPRFHTNQYPVTKGLIDHGHEVFFLVQAVGVSEDHKLVKPHKMKLSLIGKLIKKIIDKKYDKPTAESVIVNRFVPSFASVYSYIKKVRPDAVILRDRIPSTILANIACKMLGIKAVVLYNQTQLYTRRDKKQSLMRRFVFAIMPKVRYTISYIRNVFDLEEHKDQLYVKEHEYFIPFVCPINEEAKDRSYLDENRTLRILCTGKYRPYKNHHVLVDAIALLREQGRLDNIKVTILGQSHFDEEKQYKADLEECIRRKGVDDVITLRGNIPYSEMPALYRAHDVYILTSHNELASISILESMGNALVPISTSRNGTACYITEGVNGLIFRTNEPDSLADKIYELSSDRDRVAEMARAAYRYMDENCRFENHYEGLCEIYKKEFSLDLEADRAERLAKLL